MPQTTNSTISDGVSTLTNVSSISSFVHHHHHHQQQQQQWDERCLAWACQTILDERSELASDRHSLLLLFDASRVSPPLSATNASNLADRHTPVVEISIGGDKYLTRQASRVVYVYPPHLQATDTSTSDQVVVAATTTTKDFHQLADDVKDRLLELCNKSVLTIATNASPLTDDDKDLIHKYYAYLSGIPNALAKVSLITLTHEIACMKCLNLYVDDVFSVRAHRFMCPFRRGTTAAWCTFAPT